MTFTDAIVTLRSRVGDIEEARSVISRAVGDQLAPSQTSDEAARLADWVASVEYTGDETAALLAAQWLME